MIQARDGGGSDLGGCRGCNNKPSDYSGGILNREPRIQQISNEVKWK